MKAEATGVAPVPRRRMDTSKTPYMGDQPFGMSDDLLLPDAIGLDCEDVEWVPQAEGVSFRPMLMNVSQGYYVSLLRVRSAGVLSRHRHTGPVHAFTLRGSWHYLEHDWVATPLSYAFEPPGETHTLVVPEGVKEMITLFHVTGGYTYVDPDGAALGYEDVFTKIDAARAYFAEIGLSADRIERLIR